MPGAGEVATMAQASRSAFAGASGKSAGRTSGGTSTRVFGGGGEGLSGPVFPGRGSGASTTPCDHFTPAYAAAIGYLTIAIEARAALRAVEMQHFDDFGPDLKVFLSGVDGFAPDDYVDAQRLREKLREEAAAALRTVDAIALPTTATTAPTITDAEARSGIIDTVALDAACRFAFLGNLTGLPAASVPVGKDGAGLPIGLQIVGDAWDEACVLQVASHLERVGAALSPKPRDAFDLLA